MVMPMTVSDEGRDGVPGFVQELAAGVERVAEVSLDARALDHLASQVRDIEESRAAAAVSGRDYLIR